MIAKLKVPSTVKKMHFNKDSLVLFKSFKRLSIQFVDRKEFEMSLVKAMDKFYSSITWWTSLRVVIQ
jgi:hypothetical protein